MLGWEEGSLSDIDIGGLGGLVALVWCVRSQDNSSGGALQQTFRLANPSPTICAGLSSKLY